MDKAAIDNLVTDIYVNVRLLELSDWEKVSPSLIADLEKAGNIIYNIVTDIKQIVSMANGTS
ncbi:MAG: hypothetical protein EBV86_01025 [Marivivens sp.]|nr:hypothetical protein [Marivivens sp.]